MKKDFLSVADFTRKDMEDIFKLSSKLKKKPYQSLLKNKQIALIFEKPSTRTRVSFSVGIDQLDAYPITLNASELQLGRGESVEDTARVLERYVDCIVARVFEHDNLIRMARVTKIPIINSLSNLEHPCQILSDLFTIKEKYGKFKGIKLTYVGDGNNVCNSLLLGCSIVGLDVSIATPKGYEPDKNIVKKAKQIGNSDISLSNNPIEAVKDSQIIYTDTWISMHQEAEKQERLKVFKPYQVNKELLKHADPEYIFMHDLPAYRDYEVTADIIDGKHSIVWLQAGNRLHVQKAILCLLMSK